MFKNFIYATLTIILFHSSVEAGFVLKNEFQKGDLHFENVFISLEDECLIVSQEIAKMFEPDNKQDNTLSFGTVNSIEFVRSSIHVDALDISAKTWESIDTECVVNKIKSNVAKIIINGKPFIHEKGSVFFKNRIKVPKKKLPLRKRINKAIIKFLERGHHLKIIKIIDNRLKIFPIFETPDLSDPTNEELPLSKQYFSDFSYE